MNKAEKDKPAVPPDNSNVSEGKKAIDAAKIADPASAKAEDEKKDADKWRNEG